MVFDSTRIKSGDPLPMFIAIYGRHGVGKTAFLASIKTVTGKKTLIIDTEAGKSKVNSSLDVLVI
jgi:CO dehydrogenase nickel-insertion accessory protein CooC1